jgi:hypothetical protein
MTGIRIGRTGLKPLTKNQRRIAVAEVFKQHLGLDIHSKDHEVAFFTTDPIMIGNKQSTIENDARGPLTGKPYYAFYQMAERRINARPRVVCYMFPDGWRGSLQRVVADGRLNVSGCTLPWDDYKKFGTMQFIAEL